MSLNCSAWLEEGKIFIGPRARLEQDEECVALEVPGENRLPDNRVLSMEFMDREEIRSVDFQDDPFFEMVDFEKMKTPLRLRIRKQRQTDIALIVLAL